MAHREFKDAHGRTWNVWTVIPERPERRRAKAGEAQTRERRFREDPEFRVPIAEEWTDGWLAFETKGEKRRLAPIPDDWETVGERELENLCASAKLVTPTRRLSE